MDSTLPRGFDDRYPALSALFALQVAATPNHAPSLLKRLNSAEADELVVADEIAHWVTVLAGADIDTVLRDYDWICKLMLAEELHFRRSGAYRLTRFEDAVAQVYSDDALMAHYMNGLLITQVWWSNHTQTTRFFCSAFLGGFTAGFRHLEIGPGHGLLMLLAGREPLCGSLEGWDVSARSIEHTRRSMSLLDRDRPALLEIRNLFASADVGPRYDSIVLSEVLEHLDQPREALQAVAALLAPGGRVFINMPVNSPAPDHLFLLRSPEEVLAFVTDCGYRIEATQFAPQTNMTLEAARRTQATISVAVIATRAA